MLSDSEISAASDEQVTEGKQLGEDEAVEAQDTRQKGVPDKEERNSTKPIEEYTDQRIESNEFEGGESSSVRALGNAVPASSLEKSARNLEGGEAVAEFDEGSELEESVASNASSSSADEGSDALEESSRSVDINALADRYEQGSVLEDSTGSAVVDLADEDLLEVSATSSKNVESTRYKNNRELEHSGSAASSDEAENIDALDDSTSNLGRLDHLDDDSIRSHEEELRTSGDELLEALLDRDETPQRQSAGLSRFLNPLVDDDEFGETSLQSLNDDFEDESIRSHKASEGDEFGEDSIRSRDEGELGEEPTEAQLGHSEAPQERPTGLSRFLKSLTDEEEIGETSLQSLNDDFDESLIQGGHVDHENEFGETSNDVLNESASSVDHGHITHGVASTGLEELDESEENTVLEQSTEDNAMEESSSSVERREYFSDRMFTSPAYEDPLALQSDDEGDERAVVTRSDHLESSFDLHSDDEEEVGASSDTVQPVQPLKIEEKNEDEWSQEQLRAAERSIGSTIKREEDGETDPVPAKALHMEDDESSEEEQTMPVQTQTTFSASLSRFGVGTRRLNLEEDDEMDEIERLLLDQSESSMQRRLQPSPIDRLSRSFATDDEFGETSLQSEEDTFGEDSIRSRDEERGQASKSEDDVLEALQQQPAGMSRFLKPLADEDEFGETSLQSLNDDFEDAPSRPHEASVQSEEDEFGEGSVRSREEEGSKEELGEAPTIGNEARLRQKEAPQQQPRLSRFSKPLADDDEFGETSLQSLNDDFKDDSIRSHEASEGDEFGEDSIRSHNEEELGEASSSGGDMLEALLDQKEAPQRHPTGLSRVLKPLTDEGEFGEISLQPFDAVVEDDSIRPLESSLRSEEDDFGEDSIRSRGEEKHGEALMSEEPRLGKKEAPQHKSTGLSRFLKPLADDDEFGEISLQSLNDDFKDDSIRQHEASEEDEFGEGSIPSRSQEEIEKTTATGNETQLRYNEAPQQRPTGLSRFLKPLADDDEFGEASLQSLNDDFDESLIQGSHIDREDEFGETLIQSGRHGDEEFGGASIEIPGVSTHGASELSEALSHLRDGNDFISSSLRSHEEGESVLSKSGDDEFGESTGSYDEDDFGEISIPLQEEAVVAPPAPSRLPIRFNDSPNYRTVMHSPAKANRTTDSASEGEGDYMEDSFDLDESMEEEEDNEQHI